jgi:hypothetical protein
MIASTEPIHFSGTTVSPVTEREQGSIKTDWVDQTDATRKSRVKFNVWDTLEREGFRIEATGSAPAIGFYGTNAIAQQVLATGAGATVDDVITVLQNLGLCRQTA